MEHLGINDLTYATSDDESDDDSSCSSFNAKNSSPTTMFLENVDDHPLDTKKTPERKSAVVEEVDDMNNESTSGDGDVELVAQHHKKAPTETVTIERDAFSEYGDDLKVIEHFLSSHSNFRAHNECDEMDTTEDYVLYMETNASSPNAVRHTFLYALRTNDIDLVDTLLRDIGIEYILRHCMVFDGYFVANPKDSHSDKDDKTTQIACTNIFWLAAFFGNARVLQLIVEECWVLFVSKETGGFIEPCEEVKERTNEAIVSLLNKDTISYGCSTLFIAAAQNNASVIKLLLDYKVDPNEANGVGSTAAIVASSMDNLAALEVLGASDHVDFNKANKKCLTPFLASCQYGSLESVKFLMALKKCEEEKISAIDFSCRTKTGLGCVHLAAKFNRYEVMEFLCMNGENGIDLNQATVEDRNTSLHIAALYDASETVKVLLQSGKVDPLVRNRFGLTALHIASSEGNTDVVAEMAKQLKDKMNELDTSDGLGMTPLFYASWKGHKEIVKILAPLSDTNRLCNIQVLKRSTNNDDINESLQGNRRTITAQKTPLIAAVNRGFEDVVYTLLYNGADPNQADHKGYTALSHAAKDGRLQLVEILLTHGADTNKRSKKGRLPITKAKKNRHFDVVEYLEKCA